jgi:hypothetical protein
MQDLSGLIVEQDAAYTSDVTVARLQRFIEMIAHHLSKFIPPSAIHAEQPRLPYPTGGCTSLPQAP